MKRQPLYATIAPSVNLVLDGFKAEGNRTPDSHQILDELKKQYPVDYNYALNEFNGNYMRFHAYIGRMLLNQKFGPIRHTGFTSSKNRFGNQSRNSTWMI